MSHTLDQEPAPVVRMGVEEARRTMDAGSALFVDVRKPEHFDRFRIAGAVSVPIRGNTDALFKLPKDRDIILY